MLEQYEVCSNIDNCLGHLAINNRLAVAISKKRAMNNPQIPNWKLYCFDDKQQIMGYPVVMLMQSNHIRVSNIRKLTQMAMEGGLIAKWFADSGRYANQPLYNDASPRKFSLDQLFLPLVMYVMFVTFAILAFIAEHLIHFNAQMVRNKHRNFWKFAVRFIDGKRYAWVNLFHGRIKKRN